MAAPYWPLRSTWAQYHQLSPGHAGSRTSWSESESSGVLHEFGVRFAGRLGSEPDRIAIASGDLGDLCPLRRDGRDCRGVHAAGARTRTPAALGGRPSRPARGVVSVGDGHQRDQPAAPGKLTSTTSRLLAKAQVSDSIEYSSGTGSAAVPTHRFRPSTRPGSRSSGAMAATTTYGPSTRASGAWPAATPCCTASRRPAASRQSPLVPGLDAKVVRISPNCLACELIESMFGQPRRS